MPGQLHFLKNELLKLTRLTRLKSFSKCVKYELSFVEFSCNALNLNMKSTHIFLLVIPIEDGLTQLVVAIFNFKASLRCM